MKTGNVLLITLAFQLSLLQGQTANTAVIQIDAGHPAARVSPMLYGIMTEEINYSFDGGIYGELVRNRNFKEDPATPVHWQLIQEHGGTGSMSLDTAEPFNAAIPVSLKLTVSQANKKGRVGIANQGFWGIPVEPNTRYQASFYAKASPDFAGPINISIVSNEGTTVLASAHIAKVTGGWRRYQAVLSTGNVSPSAENHLLLSTGARGTVWFSMVSLFPPTWHNRPNGNREDLMKLLAEMKPSFLRFPGGNYLEGNTVATRFDWKKTLGNIGQR
ncbi:MAG: alpha-N-arabinofuranosidase, partial [Acidobacteriota bacterium]|nr:alpha-N-arabinofuranosidase [Acidobacteriota bacterium]